jgi:AAA+ ATPase superfamily predicted ATPase
MTALGEASQPLFGRFNAGVLRIAPMRYDDIALFYVNAKHYGIAEKLGMYGILGGTPRYHALVDTKRPMADEVVDILLRPQSPLQNEVQFLLGSQQIRTPAPYNAVLGAIASGTTQFGQLLNVTGIERGSLPHILKILIELGWVAKEVPFGEMGDSRTLYRVADPFLSFWYRFVTPAASALQFRDPHRIYTERIAPQLANYMGRYAFEEICVQWLQRNAAARLGMDIQEAGRYWSRNGQIEIDIIARLNGGEYLFAECKWSVGRPVGMDVYNALQGKVAALPREQYRAGARFVLFSVGGFMPELRVIANNPANRLFLVGPDDLLPGL